MSSIVSRTHFTRLNVSTGVNTTLELDVARHLWTNDRPEYSDDPEIKLKSQFASGPANVLKIGESSLPNLVSYRLLNGGYSVLLEPIAFNNNLKIQTKSLKVNLPDRILPHCFTINSFINRDSELFITADAITESGLFITIVLETAHFVENTSSSSLADYTEWCKISNAYGFEIRKPHLLYSTSFDYSVVLLKDGGIIGLKKDTSDFSFEPILFSDNSYFESLGHLFKPWSNKAKFHGEGGLSEKTVIDVIHFNDLLITVTINKKLRIWSLSRQTLLIEKNLQDFTNTTSNKPFFDSSPAKLLDILDLNIEGQAFTYLTIFLPFGEGIFKLLQLQSDPIDIVDLGQKFEFKTALPEYTSIWSVGDYKLIQGTHDPKTFELWVLWKSNTSSVIQTLLISEGGEFSWVSTTQKAIYPTLNKAKNESWSDFYNRKLFQSGLYSNEILTTVLPIFRRHFLNETQADESIEDVSLLERITKTVSKGIKLNDNNYAVTIERQWSRFDALCQEFKKQVDEPLKYFIEPESGVVLLINRNGHSIIRPLSDIETLYFNKELSMADINKLNDDGERLKFLNVISQFRKSLGRELQENVNNAFTQLVKTNDVQRSLTSSFNEIFEKNLSNKFNPNNLINFVDQLSQFNDVFKLISDVLSSQHYKSGDSVRLVGSKLTLLTTSSLVESTRQILEVNLEIVNDLLILLLVLEFDNQELLNTNLKKILGLFKKYQVLKLTYDVNFNEKHNLELEEVVPSSHNLLGLIISRYFKDGFQFSSKNFSIFINEKFFPKIHKDEFLSELIVTLIANGNADIIYQKFLPFFEDGPVFQLLKAVTYFRIGKADVAARYFTTYASKISRHKLTDDEKLLLHPVESFVVFFHSNLSKYFLNLSILFLNHYKLYEAFEFAKRARSEVSHTENDKYREQKYHTLFTIALELAEFTEAKAALTQITDAKLKEESLNRLVYTLYKTQSIKKLNTFDFYGDESKIDEILLKKAQSYTQDVMRSLFFYRALYSFRLHTKQYRGSMEALYEFIHKVYQQNDVDDELKLIIVDLYVIILNLLDTFGKEDQWIIYHINAEEDGVLSYDELKAQYQLLMNDI